MYAGDHIHIWCMWFVVFHYKFGSTKRLFQNSVLMHVCHNVCALIFPCRLWLDIFLAWRVFVNNLQELLQSITCCFGKKNYITCTCIIGEREQANLVVLMDRFSTCICDGHFSYRNVYVFLIWFNTDMFWSCARGYHSRLLMASWPLYLIWCWM